MGYCIAVAPGVLPNFDRSLKWPRRAEHRLPYHLSHHLDFTQIRNKLLIKPLKPQGLSVTAATTTLTNELGKTRGEFLKLSPGDSA